MQYASLLLVALLAGCAAHGGAGTSPVGNPSNAATEPAGLQAAAPAKSYEVEGTYVEACSCRGTCQAEVSGAATGCDALGGVVIIRGRSDGQDISGTRIAFAVDHNDQVHLYLYAPDSARLRAIEGFARAAFAGYGTVQSVKVANVNLSGTNGAYTLEVDGGSRMRLTTEPVLGGDHKSPVALENSMHPLNPTLFQGKCLGAVYCDGAHQFTLENGRNSFFNQRMMAAKSE